MSRFGSYESFLPRLAIFSVLIVGATGLYLLLAWIMRCGEISEVYGIAVHGEPQAASLAELSQES
jgi:hypothetical protein